MFDATEIPNREEYGFPGDEAEDERFDSNAAEEELATLSAHLDAATYRQLVLIRQLDDCRHWAKAGAATCAAWLSYRIGMDHGAARERLRVAHALRDLAKIADAMRHGAISYSKVRAITRVATPKNEALLLDYAQYATAAQLEKICRGIKQAQLHATDDGEPLDDAELARRAFDARNVVLRSRGDGTVQVVVTLLPDEAQRVFTAVDAMRDAMRVDCPSLPPSCADAFVRLVDLGYEEATVEVAGASVPNVSAEGAYDVSAEGAHDVSAEEAHDVSAEGAHDDSERPQTRRTRRPVRGGDTQRVVIHLAPHLLADGHVANLDDGTWISAETWRRVACDCALHVILTDDQARPLDVGRQTRSIPPTLTRALDARDGSQCRFPGCTHKRFLHRHHLEHWAHGGETNLDNLVTFCAFHHALFHEGGWRVVRDGDAFRFYRPNGTPHVWPKPKRVRDTREHFEDTHAEYSIGPETGLTKWNGDVPDYGLCVEVACAS